MKICQNINSNIKNNNNNNNTNNEKWSDFSCFWRRLLGNAFCGSSFYVLLCKSFFVAFSVHLKGVDSDEKSAALPLPRSHFAVEQQSRHAHFGGLPTLH